MARPVAGPLAPQASFFRGVLDLIGSFPIWLDLPFAIASAGRRAWSARSVWPFALVRETLLASTAQPLQASPPNGWPATAK